MRPLACLVPALLASMFFIVHARAQEPAGVSAKDAPAQTAKAKPDSLKVNNLNIDLNFLTHGEICAGGLPRDDVKDEEQVGKGGTSAFLLGRVRLILGYQRQNYRQTHRSVGHHAGLRLLERRRLRSRSLWG